MRQITKAEFDGPTPNKDMILALEVLKKLTVGNAKLRMRRWGKTTAVLVTGRPWIVVPRVDFRGGLTFGWLLWMGTIVRSHRS